MRILERYILKNVLSLFLACLLTFIFLYVIIDIFSHLDDILKQHVGFKILSSYYSSFLPIIFTQVAPFSCLLAVLYTFGKLNRNNEIIAMRSSGLSILQITKTIVIFAAVLGIAMFVLNDKVVPYSLSLTQRYKQQMENDTKKKQDQERELITNLSMYGMKNRLFFVNKFRFNESAMEGITILEHDEHQNITKKIIADRGVYRDGLWRFYRSITYYFDRYGQIKNEPQYLEEEIMSIPESPSDFFEQRQRPEFMTIAQLNGYIWKLSKSGASGVIRRLKVDLYQRYAKPLTVVMIVLLAIPFSFIMIKRATGLSSLGLSIMVGFLYYVADALCIALGYAGILPPIAAVLLSHVIVLGSSLYLIHTMP